MLLDYWNTDKLVYANDKQLCTKKIKNNCLLTILIPKELIQEFIKTVL